MPHSGTPTHTLFCGWGFAPSLGPEKTYQSEDAAANREAVAREPPGGAVSGVERKDRQTRDRPCEDQGLQAQG